MPAARRQLLRRVAVVASDISNDINLFTSRWLLSLAIECGSDHRDYNQPMLLLLAKVMAEVRANEDDRTTAGRHSKLAMTLTIPQGAVVLTGGTQSSNRMKT